MKTWIVLLLVCLAFAVRAQKPSRNIPWITISQITTCKSDTFMIKAKVLDVYRCPPCPPGAICKPCEGDHLTVEDTDADTPLQSRIFANVDGFDKNAVYIFTLVLLNKYHPDTGNKLVSFETLKK